jgi:hypothetical protein
VIKKLIPGRERRAFQFVINNTYKGVMNQMDKLHCPRQIEKIIEAVDTSKLFQYAQETFQVAFV